MTRRHWALVVLAAAVGTMMWLLHVAAPPAALTSDEGVHLVLSRALADGGGYPQEAFRWTGAGAPTPPLVPLLLSAVWRLAPAFPGNLPYLRLVSGASALGIVLVLPLYLTRIGVPAWAAVAAATLTAWSPLLMRQATSVVSALPLGLFALLALLATERATDPGRGGGAGVLAGAIAGLTCLTRWSGIPLLLVLGYQLARRSDRERATGYCYGAVLSLLPWIVWLVACGRVDGLALDSVWAAVSRLVALPALTTMASLPGLPDVAGHAATPAHQVLLYGLGATTLAAAYPYRFGPPVLAVMAASIAIPSAGFPIAFTPLLLAGLLASVASPTPSARGGLLPALVVASLLVTAGIGQYRYWQESTAPLSVASLPTLP